MKINIKTVLIVTAGVVSGALGGWMYYYFIGCHSGSCAITSKPVNSTLYGALMGGLFFNLVGDYFKNGKSEDHQK